MYRIIVFFLFSSAIFAQKPCEFSTNVSDSIGTYKATQDYIVYERKFGNSSNYLFFSLELTNGIPTLNTKFISQSKDFIKANCFDKNSKMFLQLDNGKVITLIHTDSEDCGTPIHDGSGINNRVLSGVFLFMKDSMDELLKSPVSMIRIRYATETFDLIVKSELQSELTQKKYFPNTYFIDYLNCLLKG